MARMLRCQEVDYSRCRTYHVVSRCVRSLDLLERDSGSRKDLILTLLGVLSDATCIEVAGFSIMDNHIHLLVHVSPRRAEQWSNREVARRWSMLHPPRNGNFKTIDIGTEYLDALAADVDWIERTRKKLSSLSQFMKELKQRIAQMANRADEMTGAFWEGRYKVKSVQNEAQLLATMAYIDLNPFAAGMCELPEEGRYTSLEVHQLSADLHDVKRLRSRKTKPCSRPASGSKTSTSVLRARDWLIPLSVSRCSRKTSLLQGLSLQRYLSLIDRVARLMRKGKRILKGDIEPITERIRMTTIGLRNEMLAIQTRWQHYLTRNTCVNGV